MKGRDDRCLWWCGLMGLWKMELSVGMCIDMW